MKELSEIWKTTLAQIEVKLDSPAQFKTWFKDTRLLDINGRSAEIGVKNSYTADWLNKKHYTLIKSTVSYVYGQDLTLSFSIDKTLVNTPTDRVSTDDLLKEKPILGVEGGLTSQFRNSIQASGLNSKYTFQSFIVGDSNNLAHAAAKRVAEKPGETYNPLFLHGGTGLGKTHLAQAVGRTVLDRNPNGRVVYIPSETFLNDMIKAIRTGKNIEFRKKFRTVDVLIIDDIQLISKWPKTQIEFFNTFNVLYHAQKQIILISDVSPDKLHDIDDRLQSRFQGGMVVEIYKPDFETRLAIVEKKAQSMGISLNSKIKEFIAREVVDNIRELEGALQKVTLYNSMVEGELSIEEVQKILGRDAKTKREKIKVPEVLKRVAQEYEVSVKDLKSPKRSANIAFARQIAMYILREEFKYKLEKAATLLNRKDHTTVLHAVDKISSKMMVDEGFKEQVNLIISDLRSGKFD